MMLNNGRRDVLAELINVGLGHACGAMGDLLGFAVQMGVPTVDLLTLDEARAKIAETDDTNSMAVSLDISDGMDGRASLVFPPVSAAAFIGALMGDDVKNLTEAELLENYKDDPDECLTEVGNIVINGVVGAVANGIQQKVEFSVPQTNKCSIAKLISEYSGEDERILFTIAGFSIEAINVSGNITMLFHVESVAEMMEALDRLLERL